MIRYLADTHALFWYLTGSPRMGHRAKQAFDEAARGEAQIYVPFIVLAELYFLNQKARRIERFTEMFEVFRAGEQFVLISSHPEEVLDFGMDSAVQEMHDRMVVGSARRMGVSCLTRDPAIIASGIVTTLW